MTETYEGDLSAEGLEIAIVAAKWHDRFSGDLLSGAVGCLEQLGADSDDISVYRCPGSFEVPQVASRVVEEREPDAVVCLGVLVRGETPHFDHIASQATAGIERVGTEASIPVTYGILTCDTMEQAMARSGSKQGNKGVEAARAAVEMANLYAEIDGS